MKGFDLMYYSLNDTNKKLVDDLKKKDIVDLIIKKQYTDIQLDEIKKNDFANWQLGNYKNYLMTQTKSYLAFHFIQGGFDDEKN